VLGFFSFTEITDPDAHEAYNLWHVFDHQPEQFTIDGIDFGERWVRSPRCRAAEVASQSLLEGFHYMTLYLLRDESVIPPFFDLAKDLHAKGRFFKDRKALLSGPFEIEGRWATPRVFVSPEAVPFRPSHGLYTVVGPGLESPPRLLEHDGVAGVWQFGADGRHITVAFVDGDLWRVAEALGSFCRDQVEGVEWAGPLEPVDASGWDWFATLSGR
jgi:hypothetical protein